MITAAFILSIFANGRCNLLSLDDEILFEWYFNKLKNVAIRKNKISDLLKNHKV